MEYSKPVLVEAGAATEVILGSQPGGDDNGGPPDEFDHTPAMALGLDD